ncbi:phosphate ABC transporter substrate-binding protein PstS [Actinoallomurus purpureus]|uniref:phosphate ABC transporter substrate-binding protein PstS n=1 Tax=Actinoallomurus purpureus TaxID=478114 RepID=UPI0020925735|nr:phosphate ABC transporter substrate-binding protein PstS [Actinoallomurus purpureus]MCO6008385.1 phosphate ABC transporter substrate-binding protein PstS [Actinoallomurus purpureus]
MINSTRLAAIGGVALAGALALTACGTDNNGGGGSGSGASAASGDCAKTTVNAAGSTAQANAISEWTKGYQQNCAGANLNYNANGSGAGIQAFTQGQVAFAGSDSALKPEEHGPADARCKTGKAIDLPMVVGPIAVVYNLKGVDGLQLSPTTLAGIFAGKVKTWDDAAIKKDNPQAKLPSTAIKTVHRADDSGTTDNFTKFLTATAPDIWKFAGGKKWTAPGGQGATKSDGVSTVVKQTEGAISYAELSYATNGKLQTAKVANGSGQFVEVSSDTASKGAAGATVAGTGNDLALKVDYKTKDGYPIVLVTYEVACEKGLPDQQAKFVKSYLTYTSSQQGQSVLSGLGYAPLPDSILTKVQAAVKGLS